MSQIQTKLDIFPVLSPYVHRCFGKGENSIPVAGSQDGILSNEKIHFTQQNNKRENGSRPYPIQFPSADATFPMGHALHPVAEETSQRAL